MAVSFKTALGTGLGTASSTTVTMTTTAAIAVDDLVVVRAAADSTSTTAPTITSVADGGNTYTILRQAHSGGASLAGLTAVLAVTKATVARASGSTITVTFSAATTHKAVYAESFTGCEVTVRSAAVGAVATGTTSTAASAGASGTVNAGDLVLGMIGNETRGTITGDTDTTNGSWSAIVLSKSATSGTDAGCITAAGQYKITTASGAQTYNVTAVATDWVIQCAVLQASPEPTITQAAYRWYDEGTESAAVALAAQNTAHTGDVTIADGIGQLRVRLQSTTAIAVPSTDDWQLQWEKNASGTWTNVGATATPALSDSYGSGNASDLANLRTGFDRRAQSFLGDGKVLARLGFWMHKSTEPNGNVWATLYSHTGTYGTNGLPQSMVLESTTILPSTSISLTTDAWVYFDFPQTVTLTAGTPYFAVLNTDNSVVSTVWVRTDLSGVHSGNHASYASGVWGAQAGYDMIFEVYTVDAAAVVPYDSPNLTEGAATTNRLGAGTGSFVAGKVSEDGLADNVGWTANNYTELLYSLQVKSAALVNGDTLRFRVLRNGVTTNMTYTVTPTLNAVKAQGGSAAIAWTSVPTATGTTTRRGTATIAYTETVTAAGDAPPDPGGSEQALVQSVHSRTGSAAFPANITAGNLLVATVVTFGATPIATPTDTLGQTWLPATTQLTSDNTTYQRTWYVANCAAGACTVSCSSGSGADRGLIISEFSGIVAASPLDVVNGATGGPGTTVSAGAVTPTTADSLIYASMLHTNVSMAITEDTADSFTLVAENQSGDDGVASAAQYKFVEGTTAVTPNWALGASSMWGAQVVVFKAAAEAGGWLYNSFPTVPSEFRQLITQGSQALAVASNRLMSASTGSWASFDRIGTPPPTTSLKIYTSVEVEWLTSSGGEVGMHVFCNDTTGADWTVGSTRNSIVIRQSGTMTFEHEGGGFTVAETHTATAAGVHRFDVMCDTPGEGCIAYADGEVFMSYPTGFVVFRGSSTNHQIGLFMQGNSVVRVLRWNVCDFADGMPPEETPTGNSGTATIAWTSTPTASGTAPAWSPASLPSLSAWFDGDDAATFTAPSNVVSEWRDKSTKAYHISQATAGSRPLRTASLNGRTGVVFDGTDDYLTRASGPVNNATNGSFTVFAVVRPTGNMTERNIVDADGGPGDRICQYLRADASQAETILFNTGGGNTSMKGGSLTAGTAYIMTSRCTGTAGELFLDGTSVATATPSSQRYSDKNLTIGGSLFGTQYCFPGHIFEVICCSTALSSTDRGLVEDYLTEKWVAPVTTPFLADFTTSADLTKFDFARWRTQWDDEVTANDGQDSTQTFGPDLPGDIRVTSGQLVIECAMQNYGESIARSKTPWAGTGTVAVDVTGDVISNESRAVLMILDKPYVFTGFDGENANGPKPSYGIGIYAGNPMVRAWTNYVQTDYYQGGAPGPPSGVYEKGVKQHWVLNRNATHVWLTIDGDDINCGVDIGGGVRRIPIPAGMSLAGSWPVLATHNHASVKYEPFVDTTTTLFDNLAYDGLPSARTAEVPLSGVVRFGWGLTAGTTLSTTALELGTATAAWLLFNTGTYGIDIDTASRLQYALNGNTAHEIPFPISTSANTGFGVYSLSLSVPVGELVNGVNTIVITATNLVANPGLSRVGNVQLVVTGGAAAPSAKTGTATITWSEALTAAGKRTPKATTTTTWTEALTAAGKKITQSAPVLTWTEALSAQGKRTPKATVTQATTYTLAASGVAPVLGVKQGTAAITWTEAATAAGKRTPKATATTTWTETVTATGRKIQNGSATTVWSEALTAAGKRTPKSAVTIAWTETATAQGQRTPKATSATTHTWTLAAAGIMPVVGAKLGQGVITWTSVPTAAGKKPSKATVIIAYTVVPTATGQKVQKGTATTAWIEALTAAGKKFQRGTATTVTWTETLTASGRKVTRGTAAIAYTRIFTASGESIQSFAYWNGEPVIAMQWGAAEVVDYYLEPV